MLRAGLLALVPVYLLGLDISRRLRQGEPNAKLHPGPVAVVEANYGSGPYAWVESQIRETPILGRMFASEFGQISAEERANAYLIAAAPELFAACEAMRLYLDQMGERAWDRLKRAYGTAPPYEDLVAALAKAGGESQG